MKPSLTMNMVILTGGMSYTTKNTTTMTVDNQLSIW
jgi:hypothetical protein